MKHEKIIKREDGSRIKLTVSLNEYHFNSPFKWEFEVDICGPKKRSFFGVINSDNYIYRRLSMEERKVYERNESLKHVSPEEIHEAQLELWELIKPELVNI